LKHAGVAPFPFKAKLGVPPAGEGAKGCLDVFSPLVIFFCERLSFLSRTRSVSFVGRRDWPVSVLSPIVAYPLGFFCSSIEAFVDHMLFFFPPTVESPVERVPPSPDAPLGT